jgi:3-oxoacyl-(acyl-carrier-protein) synthase
MREPISILAVGVSCPGGTGVSSLAVDWPSRRVSQIANPAAIREVATIDLAAEPFNRWRMHARLRRASALSHHLIEAVAQILESRPDINPVRVGLVGAFFIGCLVYSVRFYKGLTTDGRRFASPILFPETVVNTPLSHVVSELKIGGPVYSQTGDTSCWSAGLRTAALWLANGLVEHVIVVGGEEFDPVFLDVMDSARWFRSRPETGVAEGAGAILLGKKSSNALAHIHQIADGYSFRSRAQAAVAAENLIAEFDPSLPVADTARNWASRAVAKSLSKRTLSNACGSSGFEAFTATCAWNTILAVQAAEPRLVLPFWGLSQQMGAIEISR